MTAIDRRQLLRLAAASATTLWLPRSAWAQSLFICQLATVSIALSAVVTNP